MHFLRADGDKIARDRVAAALDAAAACWCAMVRLELCNGARGEREERVVDVLIHACATHYGAELEHADSDFVRLSQVPR